MEFVFVAAVIAAIIWANIEHKRYLASLTPEQRRRFNAEVDEEMLT